MKRDPDRTNRLGRSRRKVQTLKTLTWRDHSQPPSLSPDGRFVAYHDAADRQALPDIYIIASDGSQELGSSIPRMTTNRCLPRTARASSLKRSTRIERLVVRGGHRRPPSENPRLIWRNVSPCGQAERFGDNGSLFYWFATNDWSTCAFLDLDSVAARFGEPVRLAPVLNEVNTGPAFSPDGRQPIFPCPWRSRARADDRTRTGDSFPDCTGHLCNG